MADNGVQCFCLKLGDCAKNLRVSQNQTVHFKNCVTSPVDSQFKLIDWMQLRQGSGENENQLVHKRNVFPKACAPAFGLALQTAIVLSVNFDSKLMLTCGGPFCQFQQCTSL